MDTSQFLLRADLRSVEYPRKLEAIQRFLKETPDYFAGNSFVQAVLVVDASHIVVTPIHDPAAPDVDDLVLMAAQFLLSTSHISKPAEGDVICDYFNALAMIVDERREKNKLKLEVSRLRSLMGKIDVEKSAMDKESPYLNSVEYDYDDDDCVFDYANDWDEDLWEQRSSDCD
ncbi:hypothetical protein QR680_016116 [Steinernema hermaphroditum]|uniref:Uncharacterized protein n=1 Tax=Steinernema hermaphroditum TaxID=289476 RepID=A0AA39LLS7_9BILA|nr:hypothetical protein QR680_016116 [Steinernema hermaphroditum]